VFLLKVFLIEVFVVVGHDFLETVDDSVCEDLDDDQPLDVEFGVVVALLHKLEREVDDHGVEHLLGLLELEHLVGHVGVQNLQLVGHDLALGLGEVQELLHGGVRGVFGEFVLLLVLKGE